MKAIVIDKLLEELFNKSVTKTYSASIGGGSYQSNIIDKDARILVELIIRQHVLDNHDEKIGSLEAKVFSYESIISKSNFAPMLEKTLDVQRILDMLIKQEQLLYLEKFCSDNDILNALKITEDIIKLISPK